MSTPEARGAAKCEEANMEKEAHKKTRQCQNSAALGLVSSLFSVASVAFCVFLSFNTAEIRSRVVDLESGKGEHTFGHSVEDLNSLIQQKVDEVLSQRTYENYVRTRTARQASPECNCPPGSDKEQSRSAVGRPDSARWLGLCAARGECSAQINTIVVKDASLIFTVEP
uniref:Uncharacterized protein n=1 Tax=Knipowitschia caucasica TaxID=637954 RepID=A0AAV2KJV3_KNICA